MWKWAFSALPGLQCAAAVRPLITQTAYVCRKWARPPQESERERRVSEAADIFWQGQAMKAICALEDKATEGQGSLLAKAASLRVDLQQ